jgi:pilus assembly protein CpaB
MNTSRLIILGVAVVAAIGAGYVAKNMLTPPPPKVIVEKAPEQPAIKLSEVLILDSDVSMGSVVGDALAWQSWPADAISEAFITRESDPNALEELTGAIARVPL